LLVDDQSAGIQVLAVFSLAITLLTAAGLILSWRQFPPSEEV
jgi:hypothetical protein